MQPEFKDYIQELEGNREQKTWKPGRLKFKSWLMFCGYQASTGPKDLPARSGHASVSMIVNTISKFIAFYLKFDAFTILLNLEFHLVYLSKVHDLLFTFLFNIFDRKIS
jgi:hypothetical protein